MSGHSKWANIKHKKEKTDAQRAKVFTKIGKEITIAVKAGGGDPASNSKLRDLIQKAKSNNVPNDNIERTIKKALGATGENYEEITYVFKNEPETENFRCTKLNFAKNGITAVNLDKIGVGKDAKEFLMELELSEYNNLRYSCCMFHSQKPEASAHMFVRVRRKQK